MTTATEHYEEFATTVDLDGLAFTVEQKQSMKRVFWMFAFLTCLVCSIYCTGVFVIGYINDTPYISYYNVHTINSDDGGMAPFPDILICTSAPWDQAKIKEKNISANLVSYLTNYLFPFVPFRNFSEGNDPLVRNLTLLDELEANFTQLVNRDFSGNAMDLLNNITYSCDQVIDFCMFGYNTIYPGHQCCAYFFQSPKFGFVNWCLRTNERLTYAVQEAGSLTGIFIGLHINNPTILNNSTSMPNPIVSQNTVMLNPLVLNIAASAFSGVTSIGVAPPEDHTFLTLSALKSIAPATYNTLSITKSSLDQTDRSSFLATYTCLDNADTAVNAAWAPGYPSYTKGNCELMAKQARAAQKLNCSLIYFPPLKGSSLRYCSPKETVKFFTNLR